MSLSFHRLSLLGVCVLLAAFLPFADPARAAASYVVTKTADTSGTCSSGVNCSLREAINAANAAPGDITFNIPTSDPGYQAAGGYWRMAMSTRLPALAGGNTSINGLGGDGKPKIEINGAGTISGHGLYISSANNTVRGLILNGIIKAPSTALNGGGIIISGSAATGNQILQCYIGTNYSGIAAGGAASANNVGGGVLLEDGASNTVIDGNTISGNGGYGIYIYNAFFNNANRQSGNIIRNNYIGLAADGASALGNQQDGLYIGDNSVNTVVGPNNVISANGPAGSGVVFGVNIGGFLGTSSAYINGTRVIGNRIGTDAAGTAARPNAAGGILITSSDSTTIGGPNGSPSAPGGDGNLISGNVGSGVWVKDVPAFGSGTTGISIQNNWIGLNAAGSGALPNSESGVHLSNSANTIAVGPNNVISGNTNEGVWIQADPNKNGQPPVEATKQVRQNVITGNSIGTDASGNAAVPNKKYGVRLEGGTFGNTISNNRIRFNLFTGVYFGADIGVPPAMPTSNTISGNQIGANGVTGIALTLGSNNNTIGGAGLGNTIEGHSSSGVEIQSSGNLIKGNEIKFNQVGILISNAPNNTIGGSTLAEGNLLHDNTLHGVVVDGSAALGNRISHTTTYANGGKGIARSNGGNGPIGGASISVTPPASGLTLTGTVAGCAAAGCTIEIFTDDNPLDNEGPNFLATTPLNNITGPFSVDISGCKHYLIFTLTDSAGNTSEFLSPTTNIAQCVPSAPGVQIATDDPQPPRGVAPGSSTTYHHTVTNSGNAAGVVAVALTQPSTSWATLINNTCQGQSLAPQATCTFDVQVNVPANALSSDFNLATLDVTIGSASAQQQDRTNVLPNPSLTFEPYPAPSSNAKSTGSGQPVTYQHKLTNTGNGPDSFAISVAPPAGWTYSIQPPSVNNLAPNAFAIVTVVLTPTDGIDPGAYPATVTARSLANTSVSASVVDTTTITAAAVPQVSVASVTPPSVDPGAAVVVAYTVKNAGNLAGTFNLALAGPAGWSITQPVSPSVTLAKGASIVVSATLQAPAGAFAGAYPATLTATDQAAPAISASATATINLNKKAALALGPDFDDPTPRAPNQVISYTAQLQNNGNFTDTIGLAASASRGWPVQVVPTVTLGPGQSQLLQISLSIPPGQLVSPPNVTTITATSSLQDTPPVSATARITTTLAAVAGALLQPPTQTQSVLANSASAITYTFTLRNSGSIPQSYDLSAANVPAGWQSTLAPTQTQTLQPNQTVTVTLGLKVPAGLADGQQFSVNVLAACRESTCSAASASAVVRIGPPIQVGGACDQAVLPGTTVTCLHTITNTGSVSDTFAISLLSFLNWSTTLSPQVVILGPNSSTTFTATLLVPTSAPAGAVESLNITARSTGSPNITQHITDTITVLQFGRVSFTPSQVRPPTPGQPITFIHTLTNIGNGLDSFVITATQDLNWKITITPTQTTTLAPGINYPVTVQVDVPADATSKSLNRITVRATSVYSPTGQAVLTDLIGVTNAPSNPVYLPLIVR